MLICIHQRSAFLTIKDVLIYNHQTSAFATTKYLISNHQRVFLQPSKSSFAAMDLLYPQLSCYTVGMLDLVLLKKAPYDQVPHKIFKRFPPLEARSGQEPPFKHFKVFGSHEWVHMHFKRRSSQRFARIFTNPYNEKQFTQLRYSFGVKACCE